MSEPALEFRGIGAGYGATHVLEGIDLKVMHGERLAVIGRNGAGKTTLLATAMGLTRLHEGTVRLLGADVTLWPPHLRARAGLGLVPQTRDIFPSLTVEENLIAGARNGRPDLDRAYALFPRLAERRRNGGGQLSGGEQQMLSIARTLMGAPKLLMLDEPLEGLAPVLVDELMRVFEALAGEGRETVVLVEAHAQLAIDFAKRVAILEAGHIAWQGPKGELRRQPELLERHIGVAVTDEPRRP